MTLVRVREEAEATLPPEVREALSLRQGDYLEAELVEGGVLLRPIPAADRQAALGRLRSTLAQGSRWVGPGPEPSDDALMEEILTEVENDRRQRREGGS